MSLFRVTNVSSVYKVFFSCSYTSIQVELQQQVIYIFFTSMKLDSHWINTAFRPDCGHSDCEFRVDGLNPLLINTSMETHRQRSSFGSRPAVDAVREDHIMTTWIPVLPKTEESLSCLSSHTCVQLSKFNLVFRSRLHLPI